MNEPNYLQQFSETSRLKVGYRNRFHHPYAGVYERYRARGIELSRSDEDGAARIEAGGASVSLERFRQTHRRYWMEP
ncbi:hypothetical protein L8949_18475 [Paraburkholderia caribensis]|nr:hypothetical protein [Paraburkholderia caribensis]MCO4879025.1 hypothetical protein [Paraburkholderia caribensis]